MSEPVVRERQAVDFDHFEPRLQAAPSGRSHEDDPLAELARLVGTPHDPYQDVFAQEASIRPESNYHAGSFRQEPTFGQELQFGADDATPRFSGDFSAIEAGLRGALPTHVEAPTAGADNIYYREFEPAPAVGSADGAWQQEPAPAPVARSRRPIYVIAATIAVGVVGISGAFALKGHGTSAREVKTIMADAGPTKIQPPADAQQDSASQDSAILSKGSQPTPTKLVSNEEQPVELSQAVQENAARDAQSQGTDASSVAVPQSPDQVTSGQPATTASIGDDGSSFGISGMPAPKKVKVVSVRPDGTILPSAQQMAPERQASISDAVDDAAPAPKASEPRAFAPKASAPKAAAPKTTSRVTPTLTSLAAGDDSTATPASGKPQKSAHKAKPIHVASANASDTDTAGDPAAPKPAAVGGHVGFAVQLAAPGSESEAKSASSRFAKKFADALGGRQLGFHKAQSNGKSVYRVRVSSLSKEEAVSLCEKLKSSGGTCFVARN